MPGGMWRLRSRVLATDPPLLMGVLNVTPDSFSDGGLFLDTGDAIRQGEALAAAGADVVDVGGESTRPGADPVDGDEELRRVIPVVEALAGAEVIVSIDTTKPVVATAALDAGAEIVNDVSGLRDPGMLPLCADAGCGVVVMHSRGTPRTMQDAPGYGDVVAEVRAFLDRRAGEAVEAGIDPDRIVVDPGIGFGKTFRHNLELIDRLAEIVDLGYPVLVGTSRKGFLGSITGVDRPAARDVATAVTVALAVERGAAVVRVHEIPLARQAALLAGAIVASRNTAERSAR